MDNISRNKVVPVLKKDSRIKECFINDETRAGDIILSHSLQRWGILDRIEDTVNGNLKVYTPTSCTFDENERHSDLVPIGKAKASTFLGFCSKHDKEVFGVIEDKPFDFDSDEQCFLFSYRAFAHS